MNDMRSLMNIITSTINEGVDIHNINHLAAFTIAVAEAYDAAPRFDEADRAPWDALNRHNNEVMFKKIESKGVHVIFTPDDPYDDGSGDMPMSIRRMLWDMVMNNRLMIYSGHSDDHPVFSSSDNIVFRTVHDYYTHGKLRAVVAKQAKALGLGKNSTPTEEQLKLILPQIDVAKHGNVGHVFTLRGELNAYSTHCKLVPPAAAPALFTEIIGQVCYHECVGDFPQQKVAILHDFNFKQVGLALPGTHAAARIEEVTALVSQGAETIETSLSLRPTIVMADLMQIITRR